MRKSKTMSDRQASAFVLRHGVGSRVHKKVAESVGLNSTAFSLYLNGKRLPRGENLRKCCKAIGLSVPIFKGAKARVQQVAESGGDEASQTRELERYLAAAKDERTAEPLAPVKDPRTQSYLEDLRRRLLEDQRSSNAKQETLERLWAHLAESERGRTP